MPENHEETFDLRKLLRRPLELTLCILLITTVVVTFSQVVFRYVFHQPLSWSEELARFLFMWIALLGAAYGFKVKSHFAVIFVVKRFGKKAQRLTRHLIVVTVSAFLIVFIVKSIQYILGATLHQTAPGTHLSMAFPHSSAPVGGALMLYYLIKNWWHESRKSHEFLEQV
ncbi:MAG: TRAP transporter small permease [Deltaproteobacteria bacterium]|nr:TRAP transporter small permease [Deltaproteobacteria bacterium]